MANTASQRSLRSWHSQQISNPFRGKKKSEFVRSVGFSSQTQSLRAKELTSGRTRHVGAKFVPVGRETVGDIRPRW